MFRGWFLILIAALPAVCQQPQAKDADVVQALLQEVRQLRQDIEALTVATQRTQIALYSLQLQDQAVTRSTQKLDSVRTRCAEGETQRQQIGGEIQRLEASPTNVPEEIRSRDARLADMKRMLDATQISMQNCQANEAEAATQVRNDQALLAEIRSRIDRLDKALEKPGSEGASRPR